MEAEFGDRDKLATEVQAQFPDMEIHGGTENDPYRLPCIVHLDKGPPIDELEAWGEKHAALRVIVSGLQDTQPPHKTFGTNSVFSSGNLYGLNAHGRCPRGMGDARFVDI
eukprot:1716137-Amphidinium_carterae.1